MRCPRDKHVTTLEMCDGRKERKHHGCVTCKAPAIYRRDLKQIEAMVIGWLPMQGLVRVEGLSTKPLLLTRRVAQALSDQLKEVL